MRSWEIRSGFGLWFGIEVNELEFMVVPEDVERAIEPSADGDVVPGWRQGSCRGEELDVAGVEGDGIVVVDRTR